MEKCLVTRLKGIVNDNNIPFIGEFRVAKLDSNSTVQHAAINFITDVELTARILNDGAFFKDGTTEVDASAGKTKQIFGAMTIYVSPGALISVSPKYDIQSLTIDNVDGDISQFGKMDKLKTLSSASSTIYGDISHLETNQDLEIFKVPYASNLVGDISVFADKPIKEISIAQGNIGGISGDIASLGACTQLTYLSIAKTRVSGKIEDFVRAQILNGRTSGSVKIPYAKECQYITFNNVALSSYISGFNSSDTFSWDANGNVTWTK